MSYTLGSTYVPHGGGSISVEFNYREIVAQADQGAAWEAGNYVLNHEMLHVHDAVEHGPGLWRELGVEAEMTSVGYGSPPFTLEQYEDFTDLRTDIMVFENKVKPDVACLAN